MIQKRDSIPSQFQGLEPNFSGSSPTSILDSGLALLSEHESSTKPADMMCELWRESICLWAYDITDRCSIDRSIVEICMSYLDRYLDRYYGSNKMKVETLSKEMLQLISVTCLYLAAKLHEHRSLKCKLSMQLFVKAANGSFTVDHMQRIELQILSILGWYVNPPSRLDFAQLVVMDAVQYAKESEATDILLNPAEMDIYLDLARFLVELSVCDYYFVTKKPSEVAVSILTLAAHIMYDGNKTTKYLVFGRFIISYSNKSLLKDRYCSDQAELGQFLSRLKDLYKHSSACSDNDEATEFVMQQESNAQPLGFVTEEESDL